MGCVAGFDFSRRQTSKPSMSGIITSSSTMSHSPRSHSVSASAPFEAVMTSKYSADSRVSRSCTLAQTSSTTSTRAVIRRSSRRAEKMTHGLDEFRDRDRLRQVGFAAPFANAFFVTFHREGGDRDDRNSLQLGIVLEPFRDLEPGDFRQLNVHQDQIRSVLARA